MTVSSRVKETLAGLKGIQGTLRIYAAKSAEAEAKTAFTEAVETTAGVIDDLEARLKLIELEEPQYKGF